MFEPGRLREQQRPHVFLAPLLRTFSAALTASAQARADQPHRSADRPSRSNLMAAAGTFARQLAKGDALRRLGKAGPVCSLHERVWSAPHTYATDSKFVVISDVCWVNIGVEFDAANSAAVPAESLVKRVAPTPPTEGVVAPVKEPTVIAFFRIGPVDFQAGRCENRRRCGSQDFRRDG